jgi:hypothetical protein
MTNDHIDQAAAALRERVPFFQHYGPEALDVADALAAARMLKAPDDVIVTREELDLVAQRLRDEYDPLQRAVLDAADKWRKRIVDDPLLWADEADFGLIAAVDALRATTPKDDE